jgi:hypothetical protein
MFASRIVIQDLPTHGPRDLGIYEILRRRLQRQIRASGDPSRARTRRHRAPGRPARICPQSFSRESTHVFVLTRRALSRYVLRAWWAPGRPASGAYVERICRGRSASAPWMLASLLAAARPCMQIEIARRPTCICMHWLAS